MFGFKLTAIETFKYYYLSMINMNKVKRTMEQIVAEEIEQSKRQYGERTGFRYYFNNFYLSLPSDDFNHGGPNRDTAIELRIFDIPHEVYIKNLSEGDNRLAQRLLKMHSPLYLQQTPKQFFETIDKVLAEKGIPLEEVKMLQHEVFVIKSKDGLIAEPRTDKEVIELFNRVLPAYIKLREMGYTYRDLCG